MRIPELDVTSYLFAYLGLSTDIHMNWKQYSHLVMSFLLLTDLHLVVFIDPIQHLGRLTGVYVTRHVL